MESVLRFAVGDEPYEKALNQYSLSDIAMSMVRWTRKSRGYQADKGDTAANMTTTAIVAVSALLMGISCPDTFSASVIAAGIVQFLANQAMTCVSKVTEKAAASALTSVLENLGGVLLSQSSDIAVNMVYSTLQFVADQPERSTTEAMKLRHLC